VDSTHPGCGPDLGLHYVAVWNFLFIFSNPRSLYCLAYENIPSNVWIEEHFGKTLAESSVFAGLIPDV